MAQKKTEYQKLKAVWDNKLKESGFVDIEHADGSINSGSPNSRAWKHADLREIHEAYFRMAYHFLNEHDFESESERAIWQYHTDGLTIRDIVNTLNKALPAPKRTNKVRVWKAVKKLRDMMKARYLSV